MFDEPTKLEGLRGVRIPKPHLRVVLCRMSYDLNNCD